MQDNINNNRSDAFSEMIRQKLENHQLPVDATDWNAIEKRLKPKHKIIPWWLWLPVSSAAVLALLFTLSPFTETSKTISKSESKNIYPELVETKKPETRQTDKLIIAENAEEKRISKPFKQEKTQAINATKTQAAKPQVYFSETTELPVQGETTQILTTIKDTLNETTDKESNYNNLSTKEITAQLSIDKEDSLFSNQSKEIFPTEFNRESDDFPKPGTKNNWLLAAAFGTGGSGQNSLLGNKDMFSDIGPKSIVNATTTYSSILTPNDFTSIVHSPPVSFGLVVRKNLGKVWGFEGGLQYTYLLSTFESEGTQRSDAKLHLHYVGIPVNVVARVWKNQHWDLYLSAGGTVEKGLQSVYTQNQYFGNQTYTTTVKTKIKGLQSSLNTSVGVAYKIQPKMGIYFEPKISYYLDNNQPMSARTEQPLVVGFIAGLRFEL